MSDSVRPHRQKPTRLPCPWDSLGKNTGVGCHFLLQCRKLKSESEVTQSCLTLSDPMDCSLPNFSVHGIFQARVLEWGALAFSSINHVYLHRSYATFSPYLLIFEYRVKHTIHWEICCKPFPSGSGWKRCSFKSSNRREVMKQSWCLVDIFKVSLPLFRKYKETHGYPGRKWWKSLYLCSLMNSKFLHKEAKRTFK